MLSFIHEVIVPPGPLGVWVEAGWGLAKDVSGRDGIDEFMVFMALSRESAR